MDIKCTVEGQKLKVVTKLRHFVRGSNDFVRFLITLDEDWEGLMTFAQFRQFDNASNAYLEEVTIIEDGQTKTYQAVDLPQWPKAGPITMMLYGTGNDKVATTNAVLFMIDDNGFIFNASSTDLEPSLYEQLVTRFNDIEGKTQQVYDTVADMVADNNLKVGMHASTNGRWFAKDGGAREYIITDAAGALLVDGIRHNPLAIDLNSGTLYAVPIITDMVTVLDIGLERGRLRKSELPEGQIADDYANLHERDDSGIPATNSAKLQHYLNAIPTNGNTGFTWGGAHLNRIFFPNGHWYFRDPVVVRKPVSFIGTRNGSSLDQRAYPNYENSHIVFLATEYVCTSGSQSSSNTPYIGNGCVVAEQTDSSKLGDENYDATVTPVVRESPYFDHALFYVAYDNVSFKGLDFSAESQSKPVFIQQMHPKNYVGVGLGQRDSGWKPKGGRPWNPYTVHRKMKGVCAVIVRNPVQDDNGKIKVKTTLSGGTIASASVQYVTNVGADTPVFCKIDGCSFNGFSGTAVVSGRLSYLTESMFIHNYISYDASTDNFLYKSWFGNGFVGLVTNGHSILQSDGMYIDVMSGFAVMTSMTRSTFMKRTVRYVKSYDQETDMWPVGTKGDGGESDIMNNDYEEPFYFCEHERPSASGSLVGHFNIVIDACVMGAYYAYDSYLGAAISGVVKRCGFLYNHDVLIANKNDFLRESYFNKAKDYYDNLDTVQATYGGLSPYRWNGSAWVSSDNTDMQSITDYLNYDFGAADNVVKAYKYIKSYKSGSEAPESYVWDSSTSAWVAPETSGETRQKLSSFLALPKTYSRNLLYVNWLKAGDDGIQLEPSDEDYYEEQSSDVSSLLSNDRTENFRKLIGTAAVNVVLAKSITFSGQMLAKAFARSHDPEAGPWEATPNAMPIFGFNLRSAQNCDIRGFNRIPYASDNGRYYDGIMIPAIMQYSTKDVLIEAQPVEEEDAVFNLKTNNNAASVDDKRYLNIILSHDAGGKPTCYVSGTVYLSEDTISSTSKATPTTGATALDNTKLFNYKPYSSHYIGPKPAVIGVSLYGLGDTNKGKPVGLLSINFQTKSVNLYGFSDFDGTVLPVSI